MSEIMPDGEDLRKAVRWVSEQRDQEQGPGLPELLEAASLKFDLSPKDAAFLLNFFTKG